MYPSVTACNLGLYCINLILTLTGAEGRFRPCLPVLQIPQQFSDELQNYTLHTHTAHFAELHRRYTHTL